jgi:hypothetical protein
MHHDWIRQYCHGHALAGGDVLQIASHSIFRFLFLNTAEKKRRGKA